MPHIAPHDAAGSGVPVVLLHGSMNTRRQWRPLFNELKDSHRPIAVDLTGYGEASFPEDPENHSMADEAERVHALVHGHLAAEGPCHLVGHSYGGAVALSYAIQYPDDVSSLTLFEPMSNHLLQEVDHPLHHDGRALIDAIVALHEMGDDIGAAREFFNKLTGTEAFGLLPTGAQDALAGGVGKMLLDYRTTVETPLNIDAYRQIDLPVCLITGQQSPDLTTAISTILEENLRHVQPVTVSGDHMAPVFNAADVNAVVKDHLAALA